jgi:hypothetical protein
VSVLTAFAQSHKDNLTMCMLVLHSLSALAYSHGMTTAHRRMI